MLDDFSVTALLSNLEQLNRQNLIGRLQDIRKEHLENNRKQRADKISGILAVIQSGIKNPIHLSKSEVQEIRPTMERFVQEGSLDEGTFRMIYSN